MASIQGIYVALFGRPADPTGLAYFNSVTKNGTDLSGIGNLTGTAEYQSRFAGMSSEQVVNTIYQSLFGRSGEPSGIQFWVQQMQSGRFNINNIAIAILDGAKDSDLQTITTKVAAADLFTARLDTPAKIAAYVGNTAAQAAREFLSTVTKDNPATVSAVDTTVTKVQTIAGNTTGGGTTTGTGTTGTPGSGGTDQSGPAPDTTPPDAPTLLVSKAGISGAAEAGSTITLSAGNQILAKDIKADQKGQWVYAGKLPVNNGTEVSFTATATDAANNVSKSTLVKLTYDNVAPATPTIAFDLGSKTFSGTVEAGTTLKLASAEKILSDQIIVGSDGKWSYTLATLADNNNNSLTFTAVATDAAKNESAAASLQVTYDNVAPASPIVTFNAASKTLSGTAEALSTIAIKVNGTDVGTATADDKGQWSFAGALPSNDGSKAVTFSATAIDASNNTSTAATVDATYDNVAPPTPAIWFQFRGTVFSGNAEAGSTVHLTTTDPFTGNLVDLGSVTAGEFGTWTMKPKLPSSNYTYHLTVAATASDGAGNVSEAATIKVDFYDNVAPEAPVIYYNAADRTLSGTAEPLSLLTIKANGATIGVVEANSQGKWLVADNLPKNAGKTEVTFTATAMDYADNVSPDGILKVVYDNVTPPKPTIFFQFRGTVFSGNAEPGSIVHLTTNDPHTGNVVDLGSVTADQFGTWTMKPKLPSSNYTYQLTVAATASNAADNVSEAATIKVDFYDNIAPEAPVINYDAASKTLSGTAEPLSILTIKANGVTIGSVEASSQGKWLLTDNLPKTLGTVEVIFTATAMDYADNVSPQGILKVPGANAAPSFASSSISVDLKDSSAIGSTIYTAAATDPDNDKLTYSLSTGDKSLFAVNADGTIKLLKAVDYGQMKTASIDVAVSDGQHSVSQTITFNVKDDTKPVLSSGSSVTIDENNSVNTVVYKATAADNSKQAVVYTLDDGSKADFSISADGTVTANRSFDFEDAGKPTSLKVIATDQAGNSTTQSINFTIRDLVEDSTVTGTSSADVIDKSGSVNNWTIYGKAGNDTIKGGSGNDKIDPGSGSDTVDISGGGFDTIYINSKDRLPADQTQGGLLQIKGFQGGDPPVGGTKGILAFDVKDVVDATGNPKTFTTPFQVDPATGRLKGDGADVTDQVALVFSNFASDMQSLSRLIDDGWFSVQGGGKAYFLVGAPKHPLFYIYYAEVPKDGYYSFSFLHQIGTVEMASGQDVEFIDRANLLFI